MSFAELSTLNKQRTKDARDALHELRVKHRKKSEEPLYTTNVPKGIFGVGPDSPLHEVKDGPRMRTKKRSFEPEENLRDRSKRRRMESSEILPRQKPEPVDLGTLLDLERKWHAVCDFKELQALGMCTNELVNSIGENYGVGNGRNVRYLSEKVDKRGSLLRKAGSGRPPVVSSRIDVQEFFAAQAVEWEYDFTFEAMANALKNEFNVGSVSTVKAIMKHLEYRSARRIVRPFLTPEHKLARLAWAQRWKGFNFTDTDTVVIHIDEKCFYAFDARGKVVYLPPGVDPKPMYALSKTQIPWVMFLGVIAAPRPKRSFDGKIGLFHVGEPKIAQKNSKYHEKGEEYWANINMDGDVFMEMMKEKVIPATLAKCPWAKKIIIQMDSAGGHRIKESVGFLNSLGSKTKIRIEFVTQPCRSPDTNVLDLGIWNSMKSRVIEQKYMKNSDLSMNQRIINAVIEMWENYDPEILTSIFQTLTAILYEIEKAEGGNSFKQPRKIKRV